MMNHILGGILAIILFALGALWQIFDRLMERLFPVVARAAAVLIVLVIWSHFQLTPRQTPSAPQAAPAAAPASDPNEPPPVVMQGHTTN